MDAAVEGRIRDAVKVWVETRSKQAKDSKSGGRAQQGRRSSVTGGKHLEGFNQLVVDELANMGVKDITCRTNRAATIPGYYRASKSWDLLVLQGGSPVLLVEYKSMSGSEGKNLNNRADEVFGMAEDARQAELNGLLPPNLRRAYIFVMGISDASTRPVGITKPAPFGGADPNFEGASYLDRVALMCQRMRDSGLFHLTWALGVHEGHLAWEEPIKDVGWERFSADLQSSFKRGVPTEPAVP